MQPRHKHELQCNSGWRATVIYGDKVWVRGSWKCKTSDLILLSKYKRRPDAWNKHAVPHLESEAASFSADTAHLFRLILWLLELDSGTHKEFRQLILRKPECPEGFQQSSFKGRVREVAGYMTSLCTTWLTSCELGELTAQCHGLALSVLRLQ